MSKKKSYKTTVGKGKDVALTTLDSIYSILSYPGSPVQFISSAIDFFKTLKEERSHKNLSAFLNEWRDVDNKTKENFKKELGDDATEFIKKLLLTIDELEEENKAKLIGKFFKAALENNVSMSELKNLIHIVRQGYAPDLSYFLKLDRILKEGNHEIVSSSNVPGSDSFLVRKKLEALGLLYEYDSGGIQSGVGNPLLRFKITPIGETYLKCGK